MYSQMAPDNLNPESLKIPVLYANYYDIFNKIILLKAKAEQQTKNIRHNRYEYVSGKSDPDVYQENPFPKKIRDKETMTKYLDADENLSNSKMKVEYYDTILKFLQDILKMIHNRSYHITNSIEFMKFQSGLG